MHIQVKEKKEILKTVKCKLYETKGPVTPETTYTNL